MKYLSIWWHIYIIWKNGEEEEEESDYFTTTVNHNWYMEYFIRWYIYLIRKNGEAEEEKLGTGCRMKDFFFIWEGKTT